MSIVDVDFKAQNDGWFAIEDGSDNPETIVEINIRVLQREFHPSEQYRMIQTIFSNFNLFPQMNNSTHFGTPVSFQISNITKVKTEEDFLRFRIRVAEVGEIRSP